MAAGLAVVGLLSIGIGGALAGPPAMKPTAERAPTAASTKPQHAPLPAQSPSSAAQRPRASTAVIALAGLSVKGRAPKTGYQRHVFGSGWVDTNHNSCSTREEILRRDLRPVSVRAGTGGCVVAGGTLADPYTGRTIPFLRGPTTSGDVQIDHIVALSDAWQKGAQQWSASRRQEFANDTLELLATDGPTNTAKSDSDAASWLPPHKAFRCAFVARQISIKGQYGLSVTEAEKAAMGRVLSSCPDQPTFSRATVSRPRTATAEIQRTRSTSTPSRPHPDNARPGSAYYANCTAVRAAGAAPIRVGQPGYSPRLDRDGDGIGCE